MADAKLSGGATRPIRAGLFIEAGKDGRPKLIGNRCRETGQVFWPPEVMNPATRKPDTLESEIIDGAGRIISFTTVERSLSGFPSPYALAMIELDAGPSLIAQLDDCHDKRLDLGARVDLVIGTIKLEKDGTQIVGPKFRLSGS